MKKILLILSITLLTFNLSSLAEGKSKYPQSAKKERWEGFGSVLGGEGGIDLYNSNPNSKSFLGGNNSAHVPTMNVNPQLWQASVDVISFMPIRNSDAAGGIISTDWYENPEHPNIRYRVNILIKSIELNVNNLRVTVFKQELKDKVWREVKPSASIAEDLEEKILTKARALKIAQEH